MKTFVLALVILAYVVPGFAHERVPLTKIDCKTFTPQGVVGKELASVDVVSPEDFSSKKQVKYFGGSLVGGSDVSFETWEICGKSFGVLGDLVRPAENPDRPTGVLVTDVLKFKEEKKGLSLRFLGCKAGSKGESVEMVALVDDSKDMEWYPALRAWNVEMKTKKFVENTGKGIVCMNEMHGE